MKKTIKSQNVCYIENALFVVVQATAQIYWDVCRFTPDIKLLGYSDFLNTDNYETANNFKAMPTNVADLDAIWFKMANCYSYQANLAIAIPAKYLEMNSKSRNDDDEDSSNFYSFVFNGIKKQVCGSGEMMSFEDGIL